MNRPVFSEKRTIFRNQFVELYSITADFGSHTKEYFVTETGHRVGVVVVRNDSVLLVRQYRFILNGLSWEIPGGRVEEGEAAESAIIRECLEETGYRLDTLKPLMKYEAGLDTRSNPTEVFYSSDLTKITEHSSEIEECHWVPLERCFEMIHTQEIMDVFTISALMAYKLQQTSASKT